jgi:hypothetical protein
MHWDHLPGQAKRGDLGRLINGHSRQTILGEIAKASLSVQTVMLYGRTSVCGV